MARSIQYSVSERKDPRNPEMSGKYYAQAQAKGIANLEELAEKISYSTTMTRGDVKGVLAALEDEISERLLNGEIVQLGDVGTFRVTIQSNGCETAELFNVSNIKRANIAFRASNRLKEQLAKASYQLVPTAKKINEALKALENGSNEDSGLA